MQQTLCAQLKDYIDRDETVTLTTVIRGPSDLLGQKALIPARGVSVGALLDTPWRDQILTDAQTLMDEQVSGTRLYDKDQIQLFFDVYYAAPKLVIVGAVHIASHLIYFAKPLGFRTYLIDPRTAFATKERFPNVDEMVHTWPDDALAAIKLTSQTAVVVVTHDPKLDDPALKIALPSPAFYVGALGSPNTHDKRITRLTEEGVALGDLDRLHAPIGLNIGGRTPEEIALSIMAEIVASRNGRL
ncbi:MAG: XdhC family protein [Chloroflexota bacterium]